MAYTIIKLAFTVSALLIAVAHAASVERRQIIPAANLQLYAVQGAYSPEFQATPATVITGWNNRTINISSILTAAGPFGWPDKVRASFDVWQVLPLRNRERA